MQPATRQDGLQLGNTAKMWWAVCEGHLVTNHKTGRRSAPVSGLPCRFLQTEKGWGHRLCSITIHTAAIVCCHAQPHVRLRATLGKAATRATATFKLGNCLTGLPVEGKHPCCRSLRAESLQMHIGGIHRVAYTCDRQAAHAGRPSAQHAHQKAHTMARRSPPSRLLDRSLHICRHAVQQHVRNFEPDRVHVANFSCARRLASTTAACTAQLQLQHAPLSCRVGTVDHRWRQPASAQGAGQRLGRPVCLTCNTAAGKIPPAPKTRAGCLQVARRHRVLTASKGVQAGTRCNLLEACCYHADRHGVFTPYQRAGWTPVPCTQHAQQGRTVKPVDARNSQSNAGCSCVTRRVGAVPAQAPPKEHLHAPPPCSTHSRPSCCHATSLPQLAGRVPAAQRAETRSGRPA